MKIDLHMELAEKGSFFSHLFTQSLDILPPTSK